LTKPTTIALQRRAAVLAIYTISASNCWRAIVRKS